MGAGNEILVQFDLDLDGILKVSATERATGHQKQLTIDNAITRFRAGDRQKALARVEAMFLDGAGAALAAGGPRATHEPDSSPAAPPAEAVQLIEHCQQLIAKSEQLVEQSNPTDVAEMRQLVEHLREAISRCSQADMNSAVAQLEDLVFYIQDA